MTLPRFAILVRDHDGNDGAAVIGYGYFVTLAVAQHKEISFLSVNGGLEVFAAQTTCVWCFFSICHI